MKREIGPPSHPRHQTIEIWSENCCLPHINLKHTWSVKCKLNVTAWWKICEMRNGNEACLTTTSMKFGHRSELKVVPALWRVSITVSLWVLESVYTVPVYFICWCEDIQLVYIDMCIFVQLYRPTTFRSLIPPCSWLFCFVVEWFWVYILRIS